MTSPDLPPVTPGELLRCEFLEPLGVSAQELAAATGLPIATLEAILQGQQPIDADADSALCVHFGLRQGYWLRAEALAQDDRRQARAALETERLLSITGMRKAILEGMATPLAECSTDPGW